MGVSASITIAMNIAPYYNDDQVAIYNADSTDLSFLPPASVQLVVTSPPYNLGKDYGASRDDKTYQEYLAWTRRWGEALKHVLVPGGRVCLNIPIDINLNFRDNGRKTATKQPVLADFTRLFVHDLGYIYNTTILWLERNVSRRTAWGSWLSASDPWVNTAAEGILVLSYQTRKRDGRGRQSDLERDEFMEWVLGLWESQKNGDSDKETELKKKEISEWMLRRLWQRWISEGSTEPDLQLKEFMNWIGGAWDFPGESRKRFGHPAAFPEELPHRLIKLFSFPGDSVLDPFAGSGTTCAVAKKLGRRSIGIDIDPNFCEVTAKRCSQTTFMGIPLENGQEAGSSEQVPITKALI